MVSVTRQHTVLHNMVGFFE